MSYQEKMANKNKIPYMKVEKIFLGDSNTYITSTGEGTYSIISPSSSIIVGGDGSVNISGANVILGGKNLDFSKLPDRYIRPSGIAWGWIANNTKVVGALPIRIKGQKVYIPFMNLNVGD